MMNRIQTVVRRMNAADILRHAYAVRARVGFMLNGLMYKLQKRYQQRYARWMDKGLKDFYSMIKNHKR